MRISRRDQLILVGAGLLVVLLAIVLLLVWPQWSQLSKLDSDIATAEADVQTKQTLLAQRQQMKDQAAETSTKLLQLGTMVPDNPDLASLIIELQDTAYASGVKLVAVAPSPMTIPEGQSYAVIPLDMTVQGSWADTVDFLGRLSKLTRALRTVSFTAATLTGEEQPNFPKYSVATSVKVEAYTISSATVVPAAPAAPPAE